ncbi:Uu.00g074090.m01.CDS01 [Anthostomella pinea]|uniref:Uu.00g074090.m01.CDS01 n=1 Tax=Anthostomella pinea TaxID=933095 RepID=A0AAI8VVF4_9PEZI|nr:Uu.00g074090.m01.CDS01 [Anthostomella pinea]
MLFTTLTAAALMGLASAQTVHVVSVGTTDKQNIYSPNNIKANPGEMIQFQFRGGNHSVVQSNFDNPCTPISQHTNMTGMFSGYMDVASSEAMGAIPTYTMMVTVATPLWFYCSQAKHCQAGMVMVVNENPGANASRTLTQFQALAAVAPANIDPGTVTSGAGSTTSGGSSTGSTGSTGSSGTATGSGSSASASATTTVGTGAGSVLAVSSSMGLLSAAVAALLLL